MSNIEEFNKKVRQGLENINYPARNWVKPQIHSDGKRLLDVLIIGAGTLGLLLAHGLRRDGTGRFRILDGAPAGQEGPWLRTARMRTLRSPKHLTGPHLGNPDLTFRAWHMAAYGADAWDALDRIPRTMWMDYLNWYRSVLDIPVENDTALMEINPQDDLISAIIQGPKGPEEILCRHILLANGRGGFGGFRWPDVFKNLPADRCLHTEAGLNYQGYQGEHLVVIGGGAAAMDAGATALEQGTQRVDLLIRTKEMPLINKFKNLVYEGFFQGFRQADHQTRYDFLNYAFGEGVAPPKASVLRASGLPGFQLYLNCGVTEAKMTGDKVTLRTNQGEFTADRVILATGYAIDQESQPELKSFAHDIQIWSDHFQPDDENPESELLRFPYLGDGFQFLSRNPDRSKALARVHLFNFAATMSLGTISADIPGINIGADLLLRHLAREFFQEDLARHRQDLDDFDEPELDGDEW